MHPTQPLMSYTFVGARTAQSSFQLELMFCQIAVGYLLSTTVLLFQPVFLCFLLCHPFLDKHLSDHHFPTGCHKINNDLLPIPKHCKSITCNFSNSCLRSSICTACKSVIACSSPFFLTVASASASSSAIFT